MKYNRRPISWVTLYTTGHLHTAVPHCSHSRAPIVHTAVPRENNEHGCVYLRCRAVCKLPGCVEGHPCICLLPMTRSVVCDKNMMYFSLFCYVQYRVIFGLGTTSPNRNLTCIYPVFTIVFKLRMKPKIGTTNSAHYLWLSTLEPLVWFQGRVKF